MIRLTRRYRFSASHRLHLHSLTPEQNQALYGKCNNPHGHGHNYVLEVSVRGAIQPATGQVVSVAGLDKLVHSQIVELLDHRSLNEDVSFFQEKVPTTENLAVELQRVLEESWTSAFPDGNPVLAGIRILETKRNSVELRT